MDGFFFFFGISFIKRNIGANLAVIFRKRFQFSPYFNNQINPIIGALKIRFLVFNYVSNQQINLNHFCYRWTY